MDHICNCPPGSPFRLDKGDRHGYVQKINWKSIKEAAEISEKQTEAKERLEAEGRYRGMENLLKGRRRS